MTDINLKTLTPDTSLPTTGFLFGADSQASTNPSVYGVTTAITAILGNAASSDALVFNSDTTFSRGAIRNFRFGAADASPALAQTLSVQSVVAGTSNTAGAAFTITGSQGTGTGAGGSIVFQVAPAGSSGTAQNTLYNALTIASDAKLTIASNNPVTPSTGLTQIAMGDRGVVMSIYGTGYGTQPLYVSAPGGILVNNNTGAYVLGASADVTVSRAAAGVVQVGTTANNASGTLKAAVVGTTTAYTVATLPTGFQGARAYVTDATLPTYLGTLTGGGAVVCPVFYNGSAWVSA